LYKEYDQWAMTDRSKMNSKQSSRERDRYGDLVQRLTPYVTKYGVNAMNILCRVDIHGGNDEFSKITPEDSERASRLSRERMHLDATAKTFEMLRKTSKGAELKRIMESLKNNKEMKYKIDQELEALEKKYGEDVIGELYVHASRKHRKGLMNGGDENPLQQLNLSDEISLDDQEEVLNLWKQVQENTEEAKELDRQSEEEERELTDEEVERIKQLDEENSKIQVRLKELYRKYPSGDWKGVRAQYEKSHKPKTEEESKIQTDMWSQLAKVVKGTGIGGLMSNVGQYASQGSKSLLKKLYPFASN
jgi:hypothetical protein